MIAASPIRVLLVDDSPVALAILQRMLASSPEIQVVGAAHNGQEALQLIPQLQPAVICTDLYMPVMDGLELTREVMMRYPRPILVISAAVQQEDTKNTFQLLAAGAIDVFPKPRSGRGSDYQRYTQELITKIKVLAGVFVFRRHHKELVTADPLQSAQPLGKAPTSVRIIGIGASTGGPQALHTILTQLPPDFPTPVFCVQHISDGFLQGLIKWLASQCPMKVEIAQAGELPLPGTIYFPPEGTHLEIAHTGRFVSSSTPPLGGHRPSVTVTLRSMAHYYGSATVGVLLTGMGRDGAEGMHAIAQVGGMTIAQDEASCVVFGMPKQAIELGAARYILPLNAIARMLLTVVKARQ